MNNTTRPLQTVLSLDLQLVRIAIFSALYFVLRIIPTFVSAVPGQRPFTAADFVLAGYVILLGPWVGAASVVIGTMLGFLLFPDRFLGLGFLPGLAYVLVVGFLAKGRWALSVSLFLAIFALFTLTPLSPVLISVNIGASRVDVPFAWLHFAALLVLISPLSRRALRWIVTVDSKRLSLGLAIVSFIGTMAQHLTGAILTAVILVLVLEIPIPWDVIFYVYPVERSVIVVLSTIIASGLVKSFASASLPTFLRFTKREPQ